MSAKEPKVEQHIIDTEGQINFTKTENGLEIELFQQSFLKDEISKGQVRDLIVWFVQNF